MDAPKAEGRYLVRMIEENPNDWGFNCLDVEREGSYYYWVDVDGEVISGDVVLAYTLIQEYATDDCIDVTMFDNIPLISKANLSG